ncbi:MAG: hypothetical protein ABI553_03980 [Chloroflexota bacterium]
MSPDTDRIAVPTNGHRPQALTTPLAPLRGEPPAAEPPSGDTSDAAPSVAFTPKLAAIGFGIVASLLLLVAGRVWHRRSGG